MFDSILSHVWTLEREREDKNVKEKKPQREPIKRIVQRRAFYGNRPEVLLTRRFFLRETFPRFFAFFTAKKQQIVVAHIRMKLELRIFSIIHTNSMHDERVHLMTLINLSCQSSDFVILVQVLVRFKLSYYDKWVLKIRIPINYRESTQFLTSDSEGRQMYS